MKITTALIQKYTRRRQLPKGRAVNRAVQRSADSSQLPFYGGYFSAIGAGCWLMGWTTPIYYWLVSGMALLILTVYRLWPKPSRARTAPTMLPATRLGGLARGLCLGTLAFGLAVISVPIVRLLPIHHQYLDRDRTALEGQLRAFVDAGAFDAGCTLLERRLSEPLTEGWRRDLQARHVEILTDAGTNATDNSLKVAYWQRATMVAGDYGISAENAQLKLKAILDEQTHQKTLAEFQRAALMAEKKKIGDTITRLKTSRDFAAMDSLLRLELEDRPREHWPLPLDQLRIDNLIDWGDAIADLDEKEAKYTAAVKFARPLGFDTRLAETRLADVRRERGNQPAVLPAGAIGRIVDLGQSTGDKAGRSHTDVEVNASGKFLYGLNAKDFRVLTANNSRVAFDLIELESALARAVNVVLLLDESPSTSNLRRIMHQAATTLVHESPEAIRFRVMKFSDTARFVTDWTRDSAQVSQALALPFDGKSTALRSAIREALAELSQRQGSRLLVLFTDGKDMVPTTHNDDALVQDCRTAGVRVLAIGLVNEQLDETLLSRLSAGTNGIYLRAEKHQELVDRFRRIKTHVLRPAYRLRFSQPVREDLAIYIGSGGTQIVLSVPATSIDQPLPGESLTLGAR